MHLTGQILGYTLESVLAIFLVNRLTGKKQKKIVYFFILKIFGFC